MSPLVAACGCARPRAWPGGSLGCRPGGWTDRVARRLLLSPRWSGSPHPPWLPGSPSAGGAFGGGGVFLFPRRDGRRPGAARASGYGTTPRALLPVERAKRLDAADATATVDGDSAGIGLWVGWCEQLSRGAKGVIALGGYSPRPRRGARGAVIPIHHGNRRVCGFVHGAGRSDEGAAAGALVVTFGRTMGLSCALCCLCLVSGVVWQSPLPFFSTGLWVSGVCAAPCTSSRLFSRCVFRVPSRPNACDHRC